MRQEEIAEIAEGLRAATQKYLEFRSTVALLEALLKEIEGIVVHEGYASGAIAGKNADEKEGRDGVHRRA